MSRRVLSVLAAVLSPVSVRAYAQYIYQIGERGGDQPPYRLCIPGDCAGNSDDYPAPVYLHGMGCQWRLNGTDPHVKGEVGLPGGGTGCAAGGQASGGSLACLVLVVFGLAGPRMRARPAFRKSGV